jgi:glycosyltransferase involved in cell wall biosynthesis
VRLLSVHRYRFRKGGAEAVFLDHQELFAGRGWSCAEFVMAHPQNEPSPWERYFPDYFEPKTNLLTGLATASRFIYSRDAKVRMKKLLDDFQPDIVHVHGLYQQLTPSVLEPAVERGIPIVYTVHDYKLLCPAYFLYTEELGKCDRCARGGAWNCAIKRCVHNSRAASIVYAADSIVHRARRSYADSISAYVMPSRFILQKHEEFGFPAHKLHHIPNFFETTSDSAVDPARVQALRQQYGEHVLYFGRLSAEKGLQTLIAACAEARLALVLVGTGPEEARLRAIAERLDTRIAFCGYKAGDDLWAHVEAAMCVALPSIWYENAPKSVLEAQARGKIAVVSNIGGLPELVEDGLTGFLAKAGDSGDLARALSGVSQLSPTRRLEIGEEARRRSLTSFTRDQYYRSMTSLYASVLGVPTWTH